ncbi:cytochrome c [Castellaniella sp.]|uniref:c-type cytochrome n=1 Tax=Castellaniella sp. TaxID=1955812 RepID=UPI003563E044
MKRALYSMFMAGSLVLAGVLPGLAHAQDQKPDAAAGEQLYLNGDMSRGVLACITCHGEGGNSTIPMNPNLSAQPHEYLAKQLHDFTPQGDKPAARTGPDGAPSVMSTIAPALSAEDIRNVALYLTNQPLDWDTAPTATSEDTAERGQTIWRAGIADRHVPACAACHGAAGTGIPAEFPRLAGQYPDYILDQLKLFQTGDRKNDIMHDIADRMNQSDLAAVADYAAGLRP